MITIETRIRVSRSPNGYYLRSDKGSEMHIRGIHAKQYIQLTDQGQFVIQRITSDKTFHTRILERPLFKDGLLVTASSQQKDRIIFIFRETGDHLFHIVHRINLSTVFGEGGNPDPFAVFRTCHRFHSRKVGGMRFIKGSK